MSMRMAFGTASGALLLTLVILASVLIGARACGAGGEVVYVLPDGTQTTPVPEQRRQTEASESSATQSQPQTAAAQASQQPASVQAQPQPAAPQPPAAATAIPPQPEQPPPVAQVALPTAAPPPPVVNPRWQNKRNDLCSTLGLDAAVCGNIALNQTAPEGEAQDIQLPDEPDATPAPVDDVDAATSELEEAVEAQGEVSIQALTYVESLISQAAEAVVQAERALANQQATSAYLDEKLRELQRLRRAYAELLRKIGVELDKALDLAERIETEHLAFSKERADGEALIRYKEARLAHTAALATAEKNATAQIDAVASVNKAASNYAAERTDLAPLYKARDEAQVKYDAAVERFLEKVHEYEKNWLAVYEVYITDPAVRDADGEQPWDSYVANGKSGSHVVKAYHSPLSSYGNPYKVLGLDKLLTGTTSGVAEEKGDFKVEPVNLTLLQKAVSDADQAIVRAAAANEKAQTVAGTHADAAASMGAAISDARLGVVEAYRKHGISEGGGGQIFRFTDSGEDAVTYNISLTALNADAEANLAAFKTALNGILDKMHAAILAAEDARDKALSAAEDARFASTDTVDAEEQARQKWQDAENLRRRILLSDALMMSVGWGVIYHGIRPGSYSCASNADEPYYRTTIGIGRDSYIRKYWHKEQPIDRTYTVKRLTAVESVVDKLEEYIQGRIDYWWETEMNERFNRERAYNQCEQALSWFSERKAEIVAGNPLSTD